jgi:hydroxyacylglutathione hydrolase
MLFKRFYDSRLAQASYLIACEGSGEALVVDPNRDVDFYIREAATERVRISYVTETHIHADFVSGSRELAQVANARLFLSDEGGPDWRYAFAGESGATLLRDGDVISFGRIRVRASHTPGHTPEHMAFLVTDLAASPEPVGMLTGDFIFVGDVGRPDLLERAAHQSGTMESAARALFQSLQRTGALPDHLQIWPGHGAGSACGKALGALPHSTLGYERISNWAFRITEEDTFVREVLSGQPAPPRYFAVMKHVNKVGPPLHGPLRAPPPFDLTALTALIDKDAILVDIRPAANFAVAHIPGSLNIPLNRSFTKWAGSILPYDRDILLLADASTAPTEAATAAARELALIGIDRVRGFANDNILEEWQASGRDLETTLTVTPGEAADRVRDGSIRVLDVRDDYELAAGTLQGAQHIPLATLGDRLAELQQDKPILVYCEGGSRSAIAASLVQAAGTTGVMNLAAGITGWLRAGLPVAGASGA